MALIDGSWSKVSLLLHGDGVDGAASIVDSGPRPKAVTAVSNAKISTAQSKFGGASIRLDGVAGYISVPMSSADFNFGTSDYSIQFWYFPISAKASDRILQTRNGDFASGIYLSHDSANVLRFYHSSDGTSFAGSGIGISIVQNAWNFVQINRVGMVCKAYVNGIQSGNDYTVSGATYYNAGDTLILGGQAGASRTVNGYIDDFRITNGVARATAVPTEAFPNEGQYIVGDIPMMTLDAGFGIDVPNLLIPMMQADQNLLASADLAIPMMTLEACFGIDVPNLVIPMMRLDAAAHDSTGENSFQGAIPMMTLGADFGASVDTALPMMVLDAGMTGVALVTVDMSIPMMSLEAGGAGSPYIVTADFAIPMMALGVDCGAGVELALPMMTLEASITAGGLLTADIHIPMVGLDAQGTQQTYGWADLTIPMMMPLASVMVDFALPMMRLDAGISATVTVSYEAYSINLSHRDLEANDEVSRYTNFPFDRIVRYQGSYYGVAADGLYLLGGTTDDGAAIPYVVKTCIDDFKAPELKTVASAYLSGRLGPDATVTLFAGETGAESYDYKTSRGQGAQNHREKFGRGVKNRYFALGLGGEDTFELDNIELEINKMTRRI